MELKSYKLWDDMSSWLVTLLILFCMGMHNVTSVVTTISELSAHWLLEWGATSFDSSNSELPSNEGFWWDATSIDKSISELSLR